MRKVKLVTQEEMNALKANMIAIEDEDYCVTYEGFHYFSPGTTYFDTFYANKNQQSPIYFLMLENEKIIGILKLGHYIKEDYDFRSVNYIDIHKEYRKQGLAKELYSALNEWGKVNKDYIVGSMLSEMGKEANLYQVRKRILKDSHNFDDEYELYSYIKNKEKFCI